MLAQQQTNKRLVVKSNVLIAARLNFNMWEWRVFIMMVSMIHRNDKDFKTYKIPIKDIIKLSGTKAKDAYARIREVPDKLLKKIVQIPDVDENGKKVIIKTSVVSMVQVPVEIQKKGCLYIRFDPALKPYLLDLKKGFTMYDGCIPMRMSSPYAASIYINLKSNEYKGNLTVAVEDIKWALGVEDKYKSYGHFKDRVLYYAQKKLAEMTDITFDFEEIKEGRKVVAIKFKIRSQKLPLPLSNESTT